MKNDIEEFQDLIEKKEALKEKQIKAQGELDGLMNMFSEKYGLTNVKDIKACIEELQDEVVKDTREINKLVQELKAEMEGIV